MIGIYDENGLLAAPLLEIIHKAALAVCVVENKQGSVDIFALRAEEMRRQNGAQRGIDAVTDVLSFPSVPAGEMPPDGFWGDILLCVSRAGEQAEEYGHPLEREIAFLVVHGMLHLFGYDHIQQDEDKRMQAKQKEVLERIQLNS